MIRPVFRKALISSIRMASKGRKGSKKATYGQSVSGHGNVWYQTTVSLDPKPRGIHVITDILQELNSTNLTVTEIPELKKIKLGLANLTIQHTSASISLNECWDPQVRDDMEMMLNKIVPEKAPYTHTLEGPDDMPAHVKCSLMDASINVPITNGQLNVGTWQGIWLCEHRDHAGGRKIVVTLQGAEVEN